MLPASGVDPVHHGLVPQIDWTPPELILACDLVFQNQRRELRESDERVQRLSDLLQSDWVHPLEGRPSKFRSHGSVARKTSNIATALPGYVGAPTRGGKSERAVIADFLADPSGMRLIAEALRDSIKDDVTTPPPGDAVEPGSDTSSAREGSVKSYVAKRRERDPKLRDAKIKSATAGGEQLACEVCSFDFEMRYGSRGRGYIEVHHKNPLHVTGEVVTELEDLALLCANCHRMVHRGSWVMPDELVSVMATAAQKT